MRIFFLFFKNFFSQQGQKTNKERTNKKDIEKLYQLIVARARDPLFYDLWGVSDDVDGRFDMLILHFALIIRRFNQNHDHDKALQMLTGVFVADMDANLREMGTGDLSVPKRIKKMLEALKGRYEAYNNGLNGERSQLSEALCRNIYRGNSPDKEKVGHLLDYVYRQDKALKKANEQDILCARVNFIKPLPC